MLRVILSVTPRTDCRHCLDGYPFTLYGKMLMSMYLQYDIDTYTTTTKPSKCLYY